MTFLVVTLALIAGVAGAWGATLTVKGTGQDGKKKMVFRGLMGFAIAGGAVFATLSGWLL